jgi:transposase
MARTNEEIDTAIAMYKEGKSVDAVSRLTGISSKTIARHLCLRGVRARRGKILALTQNQKELAVLLHDQGKTEAEIGLVLHRCAATIGRALRQMGVKNRVGIGSGLTAEQIETAVSLYSQGKTKVEISRMFGKSYQCISAVFRQLGVCTPEARKPLLNEEQIAQALSMHAQGKTEVEIGLALDRHSQTISMLFRNMGVRSHKGPGSSLGAEQIEEMRRLYSEGMSTEKIAVMFGVYDGTVANYLRSVGVALRPKGFQRGAQHHAWVGGKTVSASGYTNLWLRDDDPLFCMAVNSRGQAGGYALEHRIVMARKLGRPLRDDETVHHIDGNRQNNDPSNLQLRTGRHGKGAAFRCADCGSHNIVPDEIEVDTPATN